MKNHRHVLFTLLLFFSIDVSAQSIFRTACRGNIDQLETMLKTTSIDTVDNLGRSLLHWAIACKKPKILNALLDQGIQPNLEDQDGATPLYMAVQFKDQSTLNQLTALPAYQAWAGRYGAKLLEKAILNKDLDFVKKLVADGVGINARNKRGSTPLEIAQKSFAAEIAAWLMEQGADAGLVRIPQPKGKYFGLKKPGKTPQIFAPNFISNEEYEFGSVFNAKGDEFYYGVDVNGKSEIRFTERKGSRWSNPIVLTTHDTYGFNDPFLSPDEQRLYFITKMPLDKQGPNRPDHDIWYAERTEDGWSEPINAGPQINSDGFEYYISFTKDGTMYFASSKNAPEERKGFDTDIYYSKFKNGEFQEAVRLSEAVNTPAYEADVYVAPDESYLIFCSTRQGGFGRGDLYISFKNSDGTWTQAINMGDKINTQGHELCPFVTLDGKYFLYTSREDIYWVKASVIADLRNQSNKR